MEKIIQNMNFCLCDFSNSIKDIEKIKKEVEIITLDYPSHNLLKKKKIIHKISDEFVDKKESKNITKKNYELIKWYKLKIVVEKLYFKGINIPKLFTDEFTSSLLILLKKIVEIRKIVEKFPEATFYASNENYEIIKMFTNLVKKMDSNKNNEVFYFDQIQSSFNLGTKEIKFKISNKKYKKLKQIFEKIYNIIGSNDIKSDKDFALMVELNTEYFKNLFLKANENKISTAYYGRRRPAIWNTNSWSIIKKSKCKIILTQNLSKNDLDSDTKKQVKWFLKTFNEISSDESLNEFFNIYDISIWTIVRKKILELIEPRIESVIEDIFYADILFKKFQPKVVIIISEAGRTEQIITSIAVNHKIPILHLQEGLHYDTIEAYENSNAKGVYPELATKYIVWGKTHEIDALTVGKIDKTKIEVLGSPRFENLSYNIKQNSEDYVLLATMPPQAENMNGINIKNLDEYKKNIIKICEIVLKKGKKLKIKLHPSMDILNLTNIIKEKFDEVEIIHQGNIEPLIRRCSELIVTGMSTVILQGLILRKPVISISLIDYDWGEPSVNKTKSCATTDIKKFENLFEQISSDLKFRKELIEKGEDYVSKCLTNKEIASQKIWDYVKKL